MLLRITLESPFTGRSSILPLLAILALVQACTHGALVNDRGAEVVEAQSALKTSMSDSGFERLESALSFEETLSRAQNAISKRGFKTFAVIDHAKGAASIDASLNPTTLIVFGNPKGGTPLMQSAQTMGLELPLKMLVFENADGSVMLAWPIVSDAFDRHGVTGRDAILAKVTGALSAIAQEAAARGSDSP